MSRQVMPLVCGKCEHAWSVPLRLPMPIMRFVKYTKGIVAGGCPNCGATGHDIKLPLDRGLPVTEEDGNDPR